jgi:hypothetical protein
MVVMGGYWMYGMGRRVPWGNAAWATPLDGDLRWTALTWTGLQPPDGQTLYDSSRDRFLRFPSNDIRNVWSRTAGDSGEWMPLESAGPGPTGDAPVVFDPARDQVVALFVTPTGGETIQTWTLSFGRPAIALEAVSARFDEVEIGWRAAASSGRPATIERRVESGAWATIASLAFDASGAAVFRDRDVVSGTRYAYRLGILEGGGIWYTDSTWVLVPAWPVLALHGARPNPAIRSLRVSFSLPDDAAARLEVFDVRGRRIEAHSVGSLGPGTHTLEIARGGSLPPGVYLIRLEAGGRRFSARTVVVR